MARVVRFTRLCMVSALASCLTSSAASAQWSAAATVEGFRWRELTSPIEVRETGPRFGVGVGFAQPRARGLLVAGHARLYFGAVDYHGSLLFDPTQPVQATTNYLGTTEGAELRYRWPDAVDAFVGVDLDLWRRGFSPSQRERYRFVSARLGAERVPSDRSRWVAGGGVRVLLASREDASFPDAAGTRHVTLKPGLGTNPFLHAGYRFWPQVTLLAYWDGMRIGRSDEIVLGQSQTVLYQPQTEMDVVGVGVVYGGGPRQRD